MFLIWFCFILNRIVEFRVWISSLCRSRNKWTRGIWKASAVLFAIGDYGLWLRLQLVYKMLIVLELLIYNPKYTARTPKIKVTYSCLKVKFITDNGKYKREKILVNDIKPKQEELYERDTQEVYYVTSLHLTSPHIMPWLFRSEMYSFLFRTTVCLYNQNRKGRSMNLYFLSSK